jgi:O-antigen/teichoic acid export membrane protein
VAGIEAAGIVAFSCTLLTCAGSLVSPIGIALMPYATRRVATGDVASLRQVTTHVVVATAVFGGLLMLVVEIFAGWGARWFLGVPDAGFSSVLRIVALGIIPFTIFVSCRAIVDGASVRAINARNASISLVTFGLLAAATTGSGAGLTPLLVSWVASLCLLAVLTLRDVYRLLGSTPPPAQAIKPRAFLGLEKLRTFTQPESEVK